MKNKKTLIICIVAVMTLICITVGISLAFFNYAQQGTTDNTLETGSITFLYTETSTVGRGIAIEDAFPLSDTEGKALTGEGNVFDFNISSTKSGNNKRIDYEITARKSEDSTLSDDIVVMYLTKVNGIEEKEVLLDKYSNLANTEKVTGYNEKTLYSTAVYVADSTYNQDYRLRMWIANDGTFDNDDMGKTFKVNINVYADAKVVEQGQIALENNTLIDNLSVGGSTITPVENENYEYNTVLPYDTQEANIVIETENPKATIDIKNVTSKYAYTNIIQKTSTTRKLEGLVNGDNYFDITITSENGKVEDEYILKVEVKDITPPTVSGSLSSDEKELTITYSDNVGVVGYIVSTDTIAPSSGWNSITSSTQGTLKHTFSRNGTYYIYVKDLEGNVEKSNAIIVKKCSEHLIENRNYVAGNEVVWNNLNWQVVSDNTDSVTLILKSNYTTSSFGTSTEWVNSNAYNLVNNNFINSNVNLTKAVEDGSVKYDASSESYVRIPKLAEVSTAIANASGTAFWTMTSDGNNINYALADGSTSYLSYTQSCSNRTRYSDSSYYNDGDKCYWYSSGSIKICTLIPSQNSTVASPNSSLLNVNQEYTSTTVGYDSSIDCWNTDPKCGKECRVGGYTTGVSSYTIKDNTTAAGIRPVLTVYKEN